MGGIQMIKLFLTDVDGCLTDGGLYYTEDGKESKRFCVYDGMGMVLLQKMGVPCGIITSETSDMVRHRAEKLNLRFLRMGVGRKIGDSTVTKLQACQEICDELGITLQDVCYVGDDVNDIDLLEAVGLPACPASARPEVKAIRDIRVLKTPGGQGAIRELIDDLMKQ